MVLLATACGSKDDPKPKDEQPIERKEERVSSPEAVEAKKAQQLVEQAVAEARAAEEAVVRLQAEAEAMMNRLDEAVNALASAQNQADRDAAKAKLDQLRREKTEMEARIAEARAQAARAERLKGVKISKECLENPLAKGCN